MSLIDKLEGEHASMIRPVRVSYFDPTTGEPCDAKPEPRKRAKKAIDARAQEAEQHAARKEAREIEDNMRKRVYREKYHRRQQELREGKRHTGGHNGGVKRPVVVDGVLYESVKAAAEACGSSQSWLMQRLKGGDGTCKGHAVAFADGAR